MKRFFAKVMLAVTLVTSILAPAQAFAASATDYLENKLIDHIFRGVAYTAPSTLYIALQTTTCTDSSAGTEVSGGSYARVAITSNTTNWASTGGATTTTNPSAGTGGTTSNNAAIVFPSPTANWGTIVSMSVTDASSSGNTLYCVALTTNKTVNNGDAAPQFNISAFTLQIDN